MEEHLGEDHLHNVNGWDARTVCEALSKGGIDGLLCDANSKIAKERTSIDEFMEEKGCLVKATLGGKKIDFCGERSAVGCSNKNSFVDAI